jgi:hypothetical protein
MLTLKLKVEEVDAILTSLGEMPYVKVSELINKIRTQAIPQYEALKTQEQESLIPQEETK